MKILDKSHPISNYLSPVNELKFESCVSEELLRTEKYDIEIVKGIDGNYWEEIDTMLIYPIEMGSVLEFKNHDNKNQPGYGIRQSDIIEIKIQTEIKDGFFRKKEDVLLQIMINFNGESKEILLNVEDKQIQKILESINQNRTFDYNQYLGTLSIPYESNEGSIEYATVYVKTPLIAIGENILWSNLITQGTFNRKIVWLQALTNFRIFEYNYDSHLASYASISAIDDIVVTNQKRISESQGGGTYYGTRVGSMRTGFGNTKTRSTSVTYGDVVFFANGQPFITLYQIRDPHGMARIAKSAKKQSTQIEKMLNKGTKNKIRKNSEQTLACNNCGTINNQGANFCNNCGMGLK